MSQDEVQCMTTIVGALEQSLAVSPQGQTPAKQQEAVELLELLVNLLTCDTNPVRLHRLVIVTAPSLPGTLTRYLQSHYMHDHPLVVLCTQTISKIVALCSHDHEGDGGISGMHTNLSRSCAELFHDAQLLITLQHAFTAPNTPTSIQLVVIESVFIVMMRNEGLKRHAVQEVAYVPMLLSSVAMPTSNSKDTAYNNVSYRDFNHNPDAANDRIMIRNYVAACLRELCNFVPAIPILVHHDAVTVFLHVLGEPEAVSDVVALSAEIIDSIFRHHPELLVHYPHQSDLVDIMKELLDGNSSRDKMTASPDAAVEVLEAVCKLMHTAVMLSAQSEDDRFFMATSERHMNRVLAHCLKVSSPRVQVAAARALRAYIEYCPHPHNAGYKTLSHYPTLSHLLRTIVEGTNLDPSMLFEVALLMAMGLAQNPNTRRHVHREVAQNFPLWTQQVQNTLVRALSPPSLSSALAAVVVVDCTGVLINDVQAVQWGAQTSQGPQLHPDALRTTYAHQQKRTSWQKTLQNRYVFHSPFPDIARASHLTYQILTHAVFMTFSVDTRREDQPPPPAPAQPVSRVLLSQQPENQSASPMKAPAVSSPRLAVNTSSGGSPAPHYPLTPRGAMLRTGPPMADDTVALNPATEDVYRKYDDAFKLTSMLSKHYSANAKVKEAVYVPAGDGFVIRKTTYRNPWQKLTPLEKVQSWGARDMVEGDLFYFNIPFNELSTDAIDMALNKAGQHHNNAKKLFMATPQAAKGRRWFLYDMINYVMPGITNLLKELSKLVQLHGEDNVRFPLFMYREQELFEGERSVHCGNIREVVDQVNFYFNEQLK